MRDDTFETVAQRMERLKANGVTMSQKSADASLMASREISDLARKVWRMGGTMSVGELSRMLSVTPDEIRAAYDEAFEAGKEERCAAYDRERKSGWSDEDMQTLIHLSKKGYSCERIAGILGMTENAVSTRRKILRENGELDKRNVFQWTRERRQQLVTMYKAGKTREEIADAIGASRNAVDHKIRRMSKDGEVALYKAKKWTPQEVERLIDMYQSGKPYSAIANAFDREVDAVTRKLSDMRKKGIIEQRTR